MTEEEIREGLHEILRDHIGLDILPEALIDEADLQADLKLDSIDHVEFVMAIEDRWEVVIPQVDVESWRTFGDVVEWLEGQG